MNTFHSFHWLVIECPTQCPILGDRNNRKPIESLITVRVNFVWLLLILACLGYFISMRLSPLVSLEFDQSFYFQWRKLVIDFMDSIRNMMAVLLYDMVLELKCGGKESSRVLPTTTSWKCSFLGMHSSKHLECLSKIVYLHFPALNVKNKGFGICRWENTLLA